MQSGLDAWRFFCGPEAYSLCPSAFILLTSSFILASQPPARHLAVVFHAVLDFHQGQIGLLHLIVNGLHRTRQVGEAGVHPATSGS